jgi:hypothetical protein
MLASIAIGGITAFILAAATWRAKHGRTLREPAGSYGETSRSEPNWQRMDGRPFKLHSERNK